MVLGPLNIESPDCPDRSFTVKARECGDNDMVKEVFEVDWLGPGVQDTLGSGKNEEQTVSFYN